MKGLKHYFKTLQHFCKHVTTFCILESFVTNVIEILFKCYCNLYNVIKTLFKHCFLPIIIKALKLGTIKRNKNVVKKTLSNIFSPHLDNIITAFLQNVIKAFLQNVIKVLL